MKKLSLVLALILVLTCAVLAACGSDETSTPATSKPTPSSKVESSVASSSEADSSVVESSAVDSSVVESSEVESSVVESTEVESSAVESSAAESSEVETSTPAGEGKNIAVGKTYDAKGFKVAQSEWPADYTANLTDGVAAAELTFDNQWFAFCINPGDNGSNVTNGVGSVTIDLGSSSNISKVRMNTVFGENVEGSGINGPSKIVASVSDSATGEFTVLGELKANAKDGAAWAELDCAGKGQFVKFEVSLSGTFAFINEIEVYN